jgi:hypothetical protein
MGREIVQKGRGMIRLLPGFVGNIDYRPVDEPSYQPAHSYSPNRDHIHERLFNTGLTGFIMARAASISEAIL